MLQVSKLDVHLPPQTQVERFNLGVEKSSLNFWEIEGKKTSVL